MTSNQRIGLAVGSLVLLAALLWMARPTTPAEPDTAELALVPAPAADAAPKVPRTAQPGARTRVPRVVRNVAPTAVPTPGTATVPAPTPAAPTPAPENDGPVDRRENPPADAAATRAALQTRIRAVDAAISECLEGWTALDPDMEGEVSLAFQLDASGLQDAWVVDHSDVPFGPLSCFGTAIDGVDWAGITSEPIEVSFTFGFAPEPPEAPTTGR